MKESVLILPDGLFGLLSRPDDEAVAAATAVVLLNAGRMHRIGPFRLYVDLARALARAGHPVLRLDEPGAGDARQLADRPWSERLPAVLDALAAETGCRRFVVGGICSAADNAWSLALADARVHGLLSFDGIARRGLWHRVGRLALAARRPPAQWWARLRGLFRGQGGYRPVTAVAEDYRDWPPFGEERRQCRALLERGVRILAVYTGGAANYFAHPRQFAATFGASARHPELWFRYWRDCDHLFMNPEHRRRLSRTVLEWLEPMR